MKHETIKIRVSADEKEVLKRHADRERRSLSSFILWVCDKFIKEKDMGTKE